jgi:Protein of unknown function, DUF488
METPKVVPFRTEQSHVAPRPQQRKLFENPAKAFGHVIFLDIETLSQEKIIALMNKNAVQAFVDIRKIPVFRKPKFNHKQLADYMTAKKIQYFDFTSEKSRAEIAAAFLALLASQPHPLFGQISKALDSGVTVFLCDANEETNRSISDIRNLLKYHSSYRAELHPSALVW